MRLVILLLLLSIFVISCSTNKCILKQHEVEYGEVYKGILYERKKWSETYEFIAINKYYLDTDTIKFNFNDVKFVSTISASNQRLIGRANYYKSQNKFKYLKLIKTPYFGYIKYFDYSHLDDKDKERVLRGMPVKLTFKKEKGKGVICVFGGYIEKKEGKYLSVPIQTFINSSVDYYEF
ncbi:MAG: hypothetical protein H6604_03835 [Flavobacteriales bacterium]|nr:hypothetical protein [Flavobacteriales bacterium]